MTKEESKQIRQDRLARFLAEGGSGFTDEEMLVLLLGMALPAGKDEAEAARMLFKRFGSLRKIITAPPELTALYAEEKVQNAVKALFTGARFLRKSQAKRLRTPQLAGEYAMGLLYGEHKERLFVIFMDKRMAVVSANLFALGSDSELSVYHKSILEHASRLGVPYVILAHNHPSGLLSASLEDIYTTRRIQRALADLGTRVVDHIIVGDDRFLSFAEKKLLDYIYI